MHHHDLIRSLIAEIRSLRAELEIAQENAYRHEQVATKARRRQQAQETYYNDQANTAYYDGLERDRLTRKLEHAIDLGDETDAKRYLRNLKNL